MAPLYFKRFAKKKKNGLVIKLYGFFGSFMYISLHEKGQVMMVLEFKKLPGIRLFHSRGRLGLDLIPSVPKNKIMPKLK